MILDLIKLYLGEKVFFKVEGEPRYNRPTIVYLAYCRCRDKDGHSHGFFTDIIHGYRYSALRCPKCEVDFRARAEKRRVA